MPGRYLGLVVLSLALAAGALSWTAWIVFQPRYWFADAYAEQGPRGDPGPRGERGPVGLPGPVGPAAASAIEDLDLRLTDIETRLSDLESGPGAAELEARIERLGAEFDDVDSSLADVCDAIESNYFFASNSAIDELLRDLYFACP